MKEEKKVNNFWQIIASIFVDIIIILLIVFFMYIGKKFYQSDKNKKSQSNQNNEIQQEIQVENNVENQKNTEFDIEDSLENITNEYYLNEARANTKYFNKKIKITSLIQSIDVDSSVLFNMGVTVHLYEKNAKYNIICNFKDGDSTGITKYNKGDKITVIGTMDTRIGDSPYMKNCFIVK